MNRLITLAMAAALLLTLHRAHYNVRSEGHEILQQSSRFFQDAVTRLTAVLHR